MTPSAPFSPALRALRSPTLPVARMVVGKPAEEVAVLLPRLFSLCRAAQAAAVNAALGRDVDARGIGQEILRDHLLKLCVTWPNLLGLGARPVPGLGGADSAITAGQAQAIATAIFGPTGQPPATPAEFTAFMNSDDGVAPVLSRIAQCFAPGEGATAALPLATPTTIWGDAPVENATVARHLDHPVLRRIADRHGRGPLWRAAARLYDIAAVLEGRLPPVLTPAPGEAMVPATRGVYAVRIETEGDIVTRLTRVTPTDSLLMQGGILDQSLASLPADKAGLGPLLLDILDPCAPVRLVPTDAATPREEMTDA